MSARPPAPTLTEHERMLWSDVTPDAARRLLQSALQRFAEVGFHGTTTRDIADGAEMSPAAVYVHFASKADLLFAISHTGHELSWAALEAALVAPETPPDRVAEFVRAFATWHAEYHLLARVSQNDLEALKPEHYEQILPMRHRYRPLIEAEIRRGIDSGHFDIDDVGGATHVISSMSIDILRWYTPGGERTPKGLGDLYANLTLRMLGASARPA